MTIGHREDLPLRYVLNVPSDRPDSDKVPLVIMMHGRGADAWDLANLALMLDGPGGFRFLFPNAPTPWEAAPGMTFGYTWFDGFPPLKESLAGSRKRLLAFLDAAVERYPTPDGQIIFSGFSQGALMALDCGFRTQQKLAGVVAMSGALFEPDLPDLAARKDLPVLVVHGTLDDLLNVNLGRRARRVLEDHGVNVEYHEFPMGHQVSEDSMAVVAEFVQRQLG
jgi:phospholipase/carboxylesterase